MEKEQSKVVSIRLPLSVVKAYEEMAEKVHMTRNQFLSVLLRVGFVIVDGEENHHEESERILSGVIEDVAESVTR